MKRKLLWPALLSLVLVLAMCAFCPPAFADDEVRIEVTADPTELSEGGPVLFTFEISNYSDFELHEITIGLDNAIFTIEGMEGAVIPPGGSATFPLLYEVPDSKIGLELLFQVSWLRYGEPFTMEVPVTIARAVEPIITITRTVDSAYAKQGDTIILTYELANETKFDMTNITVIDEQISDNAILRSTRAARFPSRMSIRWGRTTWSRRPSSPMTSTGRPSRFPPSSPSRCRWCSCRLI